ncbi:MAG: aminopeptidase [Rubrivivax sp.]|nr:aminopeptidase [Rubrivivax sp.]
MAAAGVVALAALAAGTVCLTSGCGTIGYYAQAVGGHLEIVGKSRSISGWIDAEGTEPRLRERLQLAQRMRDFAVQELKLPDNASYRRYADLGRSAVVWNVVAAPELSLTLKTWCFPVVGCVGYRGYFDRAGADALAGELKAQGLDVNVYGVPAYSTLGQTNWMGGDPILNTFIYWGEGELAKLMFHELAHQVAYAGDDTTFNESFAVAVERIGGARWLEQHATPEVRQADADAAQRRVDFRAITQRARTSLETLYASAITEAEKRERKAGLLAAMRAEYEQVKATRWNGFAGYDGWFARANNASLGVQAAYNELVPQFEQLFERQGRDFERFYAEVKRLAELPKAERRAALAAASAAAPAGGRR